jgi:hypothetical protein
MTKAILTILAFAFCSGLAAQDMSKFRLYKPTENADSAIAAVIHKAGREGKNIFIQIGGNWCIWCARFHDFITTDKEIDSIMNAGFVVYHLNYSKENYNAKWLAKYGYPQRFGFPVFLILNTKGELLHTQNSAYLEEGKGYNKKTVMGFLADWSPAALDPKQYKEQ